MKMMEVFILKFQFIAECRIAEIFSKWYVYTATCDCACAFDKLEGIEDVCGPGWRQGGGGSDVIRLYLSIIVISSNNAQSDTGSPALQDVPVASSDGGGVASKQDKSSLAPSQPSSASSLNTNNGMAVCMLCGCTCCQI